MGTVIVAAEFDRLEAIPLGPTGSDLAGLGEGFYNLVAEGDTDKLYRQFTRQPAFQLVKGMGSLIEWTAENLVEFAEDRGSKPSTSLRTLDEIRSQQSLNKGTNK